MVFQDNHIGEGVGEAIAAGQDANVVGRGLSLQVSLSLSLSLSLYIYIYIPDNIYIYICSRYFYSFYKRLIYVQSLII